MKKEVILITGANGMVARKLSKTFGKDYSVRFLTRKRANANEYEWNVKEGYIDINAFQNVNHIIHLAGAGIADKRWTKERKKVILSSRVDTAKLILETLKKNEIKITSFISASAIGFYGTETSDKIFTENDKKGNDFLSNVCNNWEQIANEFTVEGLSDRTVIVRIGIVLAKKGGALMKMANPIRLYIGSPLGTGQQYMPWIHIEDLCGIIKHSITYKKMIGVYNAVSPEHIRNHNFTKKIAETIKRPIIFPNIPKSIVKTLFGEMSSILLEGSRISSRKILEAGYQFKFENLEITLNDLLIDE